MRIRLLIAFTATAVLAVALRAPIPQQLTFAPYHATGIYDIGETVGWTVSLDPTLQRTPTSGRSDATMRWY